MQETQVRSLDQEDPLEKGMATHSSILAWRIPWTEKPGGLQSKPVTHSQTQLSTHTHTYLYSLKILWRRKWHPTPIFLPGKSHGQRSLVGYSPGGSQRVRPHLSTKQQECVYNNGTLSTLLKPWAFKLCTH